MIRESKARKPRPVGLNNSIDRGIISDTTCFTILRGIEVFRITGHELQKPRPIAIGLHDLLSSISSHFIEAPMSVFAESGVRHESIKPLELDPFPELTVENGKNTQEGNSSIVYSASLEGWSNERGPVLRQLAIWLLQVQ